MRKALFFLLFIGTQLLSAQTFTEAPYFNDFEGVKGSAIAVADFNGDTFPDFWITGEKTYVERSSKIYLNDGKGQFTELADTPFIGVGWGGVAIGDVNGDQLVDLLIAGLGKNKRRKGEFNITRLYLNQGK
ncbi:MAG: VCBS repeat-containing protein [Bacteroidota bacterium]